jgi:hypothetical protein
MSTKTVTTAALSAFVLGGLVVAAVWGLPKDSAVSATPAVTVTVTVPGPVTTVRVPGPVTTVRVPGPVRTVTVIKKVAAATAPAPSSVVEDGEWEVGVDVSAGTYKVTAVVDPQVMCYWKISQTGKPKNIIANDIVKVGKPTVSVKRGQDFTTQDCGTWARVR